MTSIVIIKMHCFIAFCLLDASDCMAFSFSPFLQVLSKKLIPSHEVNRFLHPSVDFLTWEFI